MDIYVGIDPSLNSTGICMQFYEGDQFIKDMFYIVKPNKLTKKEKEAQEKLLNFDYVIYEKHDLSLYKDNNLFSEYWKTINLINIVNKIKECIYDTLKGQNYNLYIVQEGISYGSSTRTKFAFDLAGLNYMIRNEFIDRDNIMFFITPPTHIKKFATGIGNCNKEQMINLFKIVQPNISNILPKVDDIADAYFICLYAKHIKENGN